MKILITGATGFIGQDLVHQLAELGHELFIVSRDPQKAALTLSENSRYLLWASHEQKPELEGVPNLDALIHLAGESISKRWSRKQKKLIRESRVLGTQNLLLALEENNIKVQTFLAGSAIGFYGTENSGILDEASPKGSGFLSDVVAEWEVETAKASRVSERVIQLRTGVVLGRNGGAFEKMIKPFKLGIGAQISDGSEYLSWIHKKDLINFIIYSLSDNNISGVVNGVSPYAVTNKEFTDQVVNILDTRKLPSIPKFVLRLVLGEMSELVTEGQQVVPAKIRQSDYRYEFPVIRDALYDLLSKVDHE